MKIYQKIPVRIVSLQDWRDSYNPTNRFIHDVNLSIIRDKISFESRLVMDGIIAGKSIAQVGRENGWKASYAYKIKKRLKAELKKILELDDVGREKYLKSKTSELKSLVTLVRVSIDKLSLSEFMNIYIYDYDPEALAKGWRATSFSSTLEEIWNNNPKTRVLAPRDHLKTTTALAYIAKKICERVHPLEINYYHLNTKLAVEKVRILRRWVERSPVLGILFDLEETKQWGENRMILKDGSIIEPIGYDSGSIGKHPHIIVLDDIIDKSIIYSDLQNKKTIERFYTDIYPQMSRDDKNKKIIIIGTAQRQDDLYNSLPDDFKTFTFKAIIDDEKKEILSPDLFTYEHLCKIREDISKQFGNRFWLKEYQNEPFEAMGEIIKPEWIRYFDTINDVKIFQGWDLSVGKKVDEGDWTAGVTIGVDESEGLKIYILDIFRARIPFGERLKVIQEQYKKWKPLAIGIEENVFQYDTVNTLSQNTTLPIIGIKTLKNKIEKFRVDLAPHFENGRVFIKPEFEDYRLELLSLPYGEHDDMADATTIAIKVSSLEVEPIIDFL